MKKKNIFARRGTIALSQMSASPGIRTPGIKTKGTIVSSRSNSISPTSPRRLRDTMQQKLANNVIKREIAITSSRIQSIGESHKSSSPNSPTRGGKKSFPNLYSHIESPEPPAMKVLKPKNHKFLKYSTNGDYDPNTTGKLFGFPPDKTTRSSVKRYSPYRHSSMSIE